MTDNVFPLRRRDGSSDPVDPDADPLVHVPSRREDRSSAEGEDPRSGAEVVGPVLEGELVDDAPVPVDSPLVPDLSAPAWERPVVRSPVLAAWIVDRDTRRAAVDWARREVWHGARFYMVRIPLYAGKLASAAPRGTGRVVAGAVRWAGDQEYADLMRTAGDGKAVARLAEIRQSRSRSRTARLAVVAGVVVLAGTGLVLAGPVWSRVVAGLVLVAVLGVVGRRKDRPIVSRHAVAKAEQAPRLTADQVIDALASIGVKLDPSRAFVSPITRDVQGWRADIDLPLGSTPAEVMDKRDKLASGLRRSIGAVWPEPDHSQHAGRLVLWVGDQDMARAKQQPWPLAKTGRVDLFAPFPFGYDQRGRVVTVTLFETNMLIGALPGAGKTASVRVPVLAAGLDPIAEVWVFELAGKGDLSPAEKFAARYASGLDDETIERTLLALRDARADIARRAEAMKRLPRSLCPEGKVTRQVAERSQLGLHPLGIVVDECQNLFSHPEYGNEAGRLAEEIIRMGRALGVFLVLATQRPNKDAIPTGVSSLAGVRFCLRVMDQTSNDMILGTSMYKNGIQASKLRATDRGIGYLVGASDEPQIVRACYLDLGASDRIADRARALREAAGLLTGYAAGEPEPGRGPMHFIVEDLLQVFGPMEEKAHSDDLCIRLADAWPDRYGGWGPRQLGAALEPYKVKPDQVWARALDGKDRNRYGVEREWLMTALEARNRPDEAPHEGPR
jgi:DNA segregation ATPase FtsK/SpoIIIE, S-DNA-T family